MQPPDPAACHRAGWRCEGPEPQGRPGRRSRVPSPLRPSQQPASIDLKSPPGSSAQSWTLVFHCFCSVRSERAAGLTGGSGQGRQVWVLVDCLGAVSGEAGLTGRRAVGKGRRSESWWTVERPYLGSRSHRQWAGGRGGWPGCWWTV